MSLSFKERIALRQAGGTVPLTTTLPVEETPKETKRFGASKQVVSNGQAEDQSDPDAGTSDDGSGLRGGGAAGDPGSTGLPSSSAAQVQDGEDGGGSVLSGAGVQRGAGGEATGSVQGIQSPDGGVSGDTGSGRVRRFGGFKYDPNAGQPDPSATSAPVKRFGQSKAAPVASAEEPVSQPQEKVKDPSPLPTVIQAFNAVSTKGQVASNGQTEGELLSGKEAPEAVRQIQQKIHELESLDDTDLRFEMVALQAMLVANPSACLYLLDEDTGLAVRALRRMTNNRVAIDMASARPTKAAKEAAAKPLTQAEMDSAWDEL